METERKWGIYALSDPRNPSAIRYVGKTSSLVKKRLGEHLAYARKTKRTSHLVNWLRQLMAEGVLPVIALIDKGIGDWEAAECFWIAQYRQQGYDLCNATDGGEGASPGRVVSQETRAKLAAANLGKKASDEARQRMSAARQGRGPVLTADSYAKMSKTKTGRPGLKPSPETVANRTAKIRLTWAKKKSEGWKPTPCSPEGRARTIAANTGRPRSAEVKAKISATKRERLGYVLSAGDRDQVSVDQEVLDGK